MSTDLVPVDTFALVPAASDLAQQIAATDFAPQGLRGKPAAVMAAMLQGHELGIGPMMALAEISVINGRPCMSAKLMRALVQRAGHEIWFEAKGNTKVTICGRRTGWPEDRIARVTWSMDDARAAGLAGGQNYRKYPRAMLGARATGELCRDNFADVLGGIGYTPEELTDGDLVADGDLELDSRADIAPEAPATNTRKASRSAVAKKAPAKKAAAPESAPAPAPEAAVPPLPGEEGYDEEPTATAPTDGDEDIVDAEVIDDNPPATLADAVEAAGLTQPKVLRRARALADEAGHAKPNAFDEIAGDVLALVLADFGLTVAGDVPSEKSTADKRRSKMHAMAAEAWDGEDRDTVETRRKGLISFVTSGRTDSSSELEPGEWDDLFESLDSIKDGTFELHLRANGEWTYQAKRSA